MIYHDETKVCTRCVKTTFFNVVPVHSMQYDMFLIINIRNKNSHNKTNRCTNFKIISKF